MIWWARMIRMASASRLVSRTREDGGWIVTSDDSEALSTLAENEGGWLARVVKITVKMTPPVMAEATVDVPNEAGETKEIETEAA
jgi:hypothetical protein